MLSQKWSHQRANFWRVPPEILNFMASAFEPLISIFIFLSSNADALHLDSLTAIPRLELTAFSCVANLIHASCERSRYEEIEDGALAVTERHK